MDLPIKTNAERSAITLIKVKLLEDGTKSSDNDIGLCMEQSNTKL